MDNFATICILCIISIKLLHFTITIILCPKHVKKCKIFQKFTWKWAPYSLNPFIFMYLYRFNFFYVEQEILAKYYSFPKFHQRSFEKFDFFALFRTLRYSTGINFVKFLTVSWQLVMCRVWEKLGSGGHGYTRIWKFRVWVYRVLEKSGLAGYGK